MVHTSEQIYGFASSSSESSKKTISFPRRGRKAAGRLPGFGERERTAGERRETRDTVVDNQQFA